MAEEEVDELPEGWKIKEDPESDLPPGWKIKDDSPEQLEEQARIKAADGYAAEGKTAEELKAMSLDEKRKYLEDLKTEREYVTSKSFTKGLLSGGTFGASENIDALKPQEGEYGGANLAGQAVGSYLPLSKLIHVFTGPAVKLASKSPILARQATALAEILGMGAAGATDSAIRSLAKGELPSDDDMLDHGLMWSALDVGLKMLGPIGKGLSAVTDFTRGLLRVSEASGKSSYSVLNGIMNEARAAGATFETPEIVAAKALEVLEQKLPQAEMALSARTASPKVETELESIAKEAFKPKEVVTPKKLVGEKVSDESISRLVNNTVAESKPIQPEDVNFSREAEDIGKTAYDRQIESVAPRAATEFELGNAIREDTEASLMAAKKEYKPFYEKAQSAAEGIHHNPTQTAEVAGNALIRISRLKTKPAEYSSTIRTLETALEDAGYTVQRSESGAIEMIVQSEEALVSDTMELAKRLNEIADYEALAPSVKDAVKDVARAAKRDVRSGLKGANEDAFKAFEMAEAEHAKVAAKYGRDNIRKIRSTEAGERVAKMIDSPSVLDDLSKTLSNKQMAQVEREVLERLNKSPYEKASAQLKELGPHLSPKSRALAEEFVAAKNPHNTVARRKAVKEGVLEDLSNALTTGERPDKVLNLWKTTKGQSLVKDTLKNSPNKDAILGYIEKQSFNDLIGTVVKDGKLNTNTLKSMMKDPAVVENIRLMGGEEAVTFFKKLDTKVGQFERNAKLIEKMPSKQEVEEAQEQMKRLKDRLEQKTVEYKLGQETLKPKQKIDKEAKEALEAKIHRGNQILKRMSQKDYPLKAKIDRWEEFVKDTLGLNAKAAMSVFGIAKLGGAGTFQAAALGIPGTVGTMFAYKMFTKMITSPTVRKSFAKSTKKAVNPVTALLAIEAFGASLEE